MLQDVLSALEGGDLASSSLGPPNAVPLEAAQLDALPESISDLHHGMPRALHEAPMRFLLVDTVLGWRQLKVYEDVQVEHECMEKPYKLVNEGDWRAAAVLSWRWAHPKPYPQQPGFSPMSDAQYAELQGLLRHVSRQGIKYVWIDWSCVPQYVTESMVEVLRSRVRKPPLSQLRTQK